VQVIAFNLDAYYHLRLEGSDWRPYVGGGLDVTYYSIDNLPEWADNTDTEVGLNLVGGFVIPTRSSNQWFLELRLGVGDIPDLKIMTGLNFGR
jgi:outer membrane protein W